MIKTLTISMRKWAHGNRGGFKTAQLLESESQRMCCLGFLGVACGIEKDVLTNRGTPSCTLPTIPKKAWPKGVLKRDGTNTKWTQKAVHLNDGNILQDTEIAITLERRKKYIRSHFKEIGIKVRFVP